MAERARNRRRIRNAGCDFQYPYFIFLISNFQFKISFVRILPADSTGIDEALVVLRSGGIIAHATETCYGFACDLANPKAVKRLFQLKKRSVDQPVSALFASIDEAKKYVIWNARAEELAKEHLPGPLTLILPLRTDAPPIFITPINRITNQRAVGLRISSNSFTQQLIESFGSPLSTTSANLHGQPNPYSTEDIVSQFPNASVQPDLILDSGALKKVPPSTVIDLTKTRKKENILRKGTI